jgi:putative addiction module component (TIGR02574 family)
VPVTKGTSKLLEEALKLAVGERAELASELIASLDAESDEDAEAAWALEIEERAARARSGEDPGKPWSEVRDRLERDLKNR